MPLNVGAKMKSQFDAMIALNYLRWIQLIGEITNWEFHFRPISE